MQTGHKKGVSERCLNPLCKNPVVTHPKAIHPRRFCSDQCRMDHWVLHRVAMMLSSLGPKKVWETLSGLSGGKYISPLEARNGQRVNSVRRQKLRDSAIKVGEREPISLDQLVRVIKVWDQLKLREPYKRLKKGNSQGRARGEIVNPEVNWGEV